MLTSPRAFRPYDPNQQLLLPPDLTEWVPKEHLVRLVGDLVDNVLQPERRAESAEWARATGVPFWLSRPGLRSYPTPRRQVFTFLSGGSRWKPAMGSGGASSLAIAY